MLGSSCEHCSRATTICSQRLRARCSWTLNGSIPVARSIPDALRLGAASRGLRGRVRAALPSIAVRISICLPDDAVISQDECVLKSVLAFTNRVGTLSVGPARDCRGVSRV